MTATHEEELYAELFALSDDDLYEQLGKQISGQQALPPSGDFLRSAGRAWLESNRDRIAASVCPSERIRKIAASDPGAVDKVLIASIIADLLGGSGFAAAGVIVTRAGIHELCKEVWR